MRVKTFQSYLRGFSKCSRFHYQVYSDTVKSGSGLAFMVTLLYHEEESMELVTDSCPWLAFF